MGEGLSVALVVLMGVVLVAWANTPGSPSPAAFLILFAIGAWMLSVLAGEMQNEPRE